MDATTQQFVASLHELADFYEKHPEVPLPFGNRLSLSIYSVDTPAELAPIAKAFGTAKKSYSDHHFHLEHDFGIINLDVVANRDAVCKRVVIGKRTIPAKTIPASPEMVVPESTEEIYEWQCTEPLLAAEGE